MKITPFGKVKNEYSVISNLLDSELSTEEENDEINNRDEDSESDKNSDEDSLESSSPGKIKILKVQEAIEEIVGEPSIDNLMIILSAIGMKSISLKVSEERNNLSVSGIIDFSEPDNKISKKD